ncbi:acyl carrier protein [Streptomyces sp. NPDC054844]
MTTATLNIEDLRALIAGALETEPEEVTNEAHFTDELEIDSLMLLEISTRVENAYGVPVDDVVISGVQSLVELHTFLASKIAGEPSA